LYIVVYVQRGSMKISVVGGYGVGMTMRLARFPRAGETVADAALSVGPGGKGSNQAIACARLGAEVALFTAVGRDSAAGDARALWSAEGIDVASVVDKDSETMTGFIFVDSSGENRIAVAPGALGELDVSDLEGFRDTVCASDLLVVSLEIPVAVAVAALSIARDAGVRTVLNPAPAKPLPVEAWQYIDFLTPNVTEGRVLAAAGEPDVDSDPESIAARLQSRFGGVVVMTRGSFPTLIATETETFSVDSLPVAKIEDTTGAGDAFTAAFAVGVAEGRDVVDAVRFANAAGALAVGKREVVPSLPTRSDVERSLAVHDAKADLS
jgi:ribokinase